MTLQDIPQKRVDKHMSTRSSINKASPGGFLGTLNSDIESAGRVLPAVRRYEKFALCQPEGGSPKMPFISDTRRCSVWGSVGGVSGRGVGGGLPACPSPGALWGLCEGGYLTPKLSRFARSLHCGGRGVPGVEGCVEGCVGCVLHVWVGSRCGCCARISTAIPGGCPLEGTKKNIGALSWAGRWTATDTCLVGRAGLRENTVLGGVGGRAGELSWEGVLFARESVCPGAGAQ